MYSVDSVIRPEELPIYAKKKGLDGVAITDHDRLDSGIKISRDIDFLILPGMEISSRDGHIIGLNLKETVQKGLSADETVKKIHEAGGIAIACHPSSLFKRSLGKCADSEFDAIELINSSSIPFGYSIKHTQKIASQLGIAQVAGSDAHYAPEIGTAYTLIDSEPNVDTIVDAIRKRKCQPYGMGIPLALRFRRTLLTVRKRLNP